MAYALEDLGYAGLDRTNVIKVGSPRLALEHFGTERTTTYHMGDDLVARIPFPLGLGNNKALPMTLSRPVETEIRGLALDDLDYFLPISVEMSDTKQHG